jgi:hypothetical protein
MSNAPLVMKNEGASHEVMQSSATSKQSSREDQPGKSSSAWHEVKQQAVQAAARQVPSDADAREALGFMPLKMKGATIRWRGL